MGEAAAIARLIEHLGLPQTRAIKLLLAAFAVGVACNMATAAYDTARSRPISTEYDWKTNKS